jgi:hypothetical protein
MKLYNLVKAKTGYISPELWKDALKEAKRDIKANREIVQANQKEWEFDTWSKAKQLEYVSNVMSAYCCMVIMRV